MEVGDLVRFKRELRGLGKAIGIILEAHENSVLVQWSRWPNERWTKINPAEELKSFVEVVSESR